jgi:hypothetical protein
MSLLIPRGGQIRQTVSSRIFNIDSGAASTIDDVLLRSAVPIRLLAARVVYTTEDTGTVASANVKVGTAVDGAQIVAATALENTKAVGTTTALTLVSTTVAANTPIVVRHTGLAATAAGEYRVELDYEVLP